MMGLGPIPMTVLPVTVTLGPLPLLYISSFLNELASSFVFLTNNEVKLQVIDKSDFARFRLDVDFNCPISTYTLD
jgi:hypothetical protein